VLTGSRLLHFITPHHGALYIADIGSNINAGNGIGGGVFKVSLGPNGLPISSTRLLDLDGAISVAFSPQGDEMFVATHFTGLIEGFAVGPGDTIAINPNLVMDGGTLGIWDGAHVSFGGMEVTAVPEPATYALMLGALCAIVARYKALRRNAHKSGKCEELTAKLRSSPNEKSDLHRV
jgi:hypothetical protein